MSLKPLSADEMKAAMAIFKGMRAADAAAQHGISIATIYRRMKDQAWLEYMEELGAPLKSKIATQAKEAAVEVIWNFSESAKRKLRIADSPKAKHSDQLMAIKALDEMYGILKTQPPKNELGDGVPSGPDVYRSAWRQ